MDTNTTAILNMAYPEVEDKLSKSISTTRYKQFMSKFMQKRQQQLYANVPAKQIYYGDEDVKDWFATTGIDRRIIRKAIRNTYFPTIPNFNPRCAKDDSTIALLCMVRYYYLNNKQQELNLALINLSFSGKMYPSIFYGSYKFEPPEHIMDYVINHMINNKFDIAKYGNVINSVRSIAETWITTYKDRLKSFSDDDCKYILQQLHNRIGSFIHNIAEIFYEVYKNSNMYMTYDSDDVSEDNYHLADNDSFKIDRIVENSMKELTTKGIDYANCNRACNSMVKFDELKAIIDSILANNDNIPLIKEYATLMVALYFQDSNTKNINDISFISFSIKPVPNTHNKYVLRKKELVDLILINNAENFARRRSRAATESAYYRAFNAYMALIIQKANK